MEVVQQAVEVVQQEVEVVQTDEKDMVFVVWQPTLSHSVVELLARTSFATVAAGGVVGGVSTTPLVPVVAGCFPVVAGAWVM